MFYKFTQPIGISAYGAYVPRLKLPVNEISKFHGHKKSTLKHFKAIAEKDEDTATFSIEILNNLQTNFPNVDLQSVESVYVGSESHPYAVKPTGTILAEYLGTNDLTSANLEFACKAGTAAMQIVAAQTACGMVSSGLAIGTDIAQARPADVLEMTAGAGGAGFLITKERENLVAKFLYTASVTTNTPDFWRRPGEKYPRHLQRFTGKPAYLKHVSMAIEKLLAGSKLNSENFDQVVLHSPNLKFPELIAKKYHFKNSSLVHRKLFPEIGNAYAGSSMLGLAYALDTSKPGDLILMVSYGSGAGSDAFVLQKKSGKRMANKLTDQFKNRKLINYSEYLKLA